MKTLKLFFASLLFTIAIFYIGCSNSSNTVTTPPASTDSLMFSFDSMAVYSDSSIHVKSFNINVPVCNILKFRVECELSTNDTTQLSDVYITIRDSSTFNGQFVYEKRGTSINTNMNETLNFNFPLPFYLFGGVYIGFSGSSIEPHKFIRVKNFKLYKVI